MLWAQQAWIRTVMQPMSVVAKQLPMEGGFSLVHSDSLEEYDLFCGAGAQVQLVGSSAEHPSSPPDKQMDKSMHVHSHMRMPPSPPIYSVASYSFERSWSEGNSNRAHLGGSGKRRRVPRLVDTVGLPKGLPSPSILLLTLLQGSQTSIQCLPVSICICLRELLDRAFQRTAMIGSCLQGQQNIINSVRD